MAQVHADLTHNTFQHFEEGFLQKHGYVSGILEIASMSS